MEQLLQVCPMLILMLILPPPPLPLAVQVVEDDPPRLTAGTFSTEFEDFIATCLKKEYTARPNYEQLLRHSFIVEHLQRNTDISEFVARILDLPDEQASQ